MELSDLKTFRDKLLSEKQSKIDSINLTYKKKLDALAVLLESDDAAPVAEESKWKKILPAPVNVFSAVRRAISETAINADSVFSSESLFAHISKSYSNAGSLAVKASDLSGSLWRLKKSGEIELLTKGSGQVASTYKKTDKFVSV